MTAWLGSDLILPFPFPDLFLDLFLNFPEDTYSTKTSVTPGSHL